MAIAVAVGWTVVGATVAGDEGELACVGGDVGVAVSAVGAGAGAVGAAATAPMGEAGAALG